MLTVDLRQVVDTPRRYTWTLKAEPDAAACETLAARLKLPAVVSVSAEITVSPRSDARWTVHGQATATVEQVCCRTGETFSSVLQTSFDEDFTTRPPVAADNEDPDHPEYVAGTLDLTDLATQYLALELDPFPIAPTAGEWSDHIEATAVNESPFAVLGQDFTSQVG